MNRNVEAGHIVETMEPEQRPLERGEIAGLGPSRTYRTCRTHRTYRTYRTWPSCPESSRRRQHVEMGQITRRCVAAVESPAHIHDWHVERSAVERHEQRCLVEHVCQRVEHRVFAAWSVQEK